VEEGEEWGQKEREEEEGYSAAALIPQGDSVSGICVNAPGPPQGGSVRAVGRRAMLGRYGGEQGYVLTGVPEHK
jgi:hypothetical protein